MFYNSHLVIATPNAYVAVILLNKWNCVPYSIYCTLLYHTYLLILIGLSYGEDLLKFRKNCAEVFISLACVPLWRSLLFRRPGWGGTPHSAIYVCVSNICTYRRNSMGFNRIIANDTYVYAPIPALGAGVNVRACELETPCSNPCQGCNSRPFSFWCL